MEAASEAPSSNAAQDTVAGCAGAIAKLAFGHPFDTIKVRMQSLAQSQFVTMLGAFRFTITNEGVLGLYRGLSVTIPGLLLYNSALFTAYGYACDQQAGAGTGLALHQIALAGAFAGATCNLLHSPFEYVRCRQQARRAVSGVLGLGLYRGLHLTLCREIPANALYFSTYEGLVRWYRRRDEHGGADSSLSMRVHHVPAYVIAMAGGCAGVANWLLVFPIDVVKSRWQTDCIERPRYRSVSDCIMQLYSRGGIAAFWRGLSACLTRAFVANSATFGVVEVTRRFFVSDSD